MKMEIKPLLVLVSVLSSLATAQAAGKEPCSTKGLDLFPAEYAAGSSESDLRFLTASPFQLSILNYELVPESRLVRLTLSKKSAKELSKLSEKFLEKRLAVVVDGQVVSSPVIRQKISGDSLAVTFHDLAGYEAFAATVAASETC